VYKHKYQGHFDYYSIKAYNNHSIDYPFDHFENYFYVKENKKKKESIGIPVIYALCRNIESSLALKIILFTLRVNLKYNNIKSKVNIHDEISTMGPDTNAYKKKIQNSLGECKKDEIYFNDKTGLSFLNKNFPSDQYHYLWVKDDFIIHPTTNFNVDRKGKLNKKKFICNYESLDHPNKNPFFAPLVKLKFTNEKLNPNTANYDLIRFNDNNFKILNQDEIIIIVPAPDTSGNGSRSLYQKDNNFSKEDMFNKKQFLLIKPSSEFVTAAYQMNFTPVLPINFVTNQLRRNMVQHINHQFYTSPEEFIAFSRKFNRLDHQHVLTLKDFISFPSVVFIFALKLYYIAPSSKGFSLLRLLLMIHIKKQTFLNPRFNNKGR